MDGMVLRDNKLPATIEELIDFVIVGNEAIKSFQAKLRACNKSEIAKFARDQALTDGRKVSRLVIDAEIRLGELLEQTVEPRGNITLGSHGRTKSLPSNINKKESFYAQEISRNQDIANEVFETKKNDIPTRHDILKKIEQTKRKKKDEEQEQKRYEDIKKIQNIQTLNDLISQKIRFTTLLIDPPWDWSDEGDKNQLGRAKPTYATISIEELLKLPIKDLSNINSHIYLWITNRSLPKGFQLLEQWGFRYITTLTWAKPSYGMGNYFRGQTEHILFGIKGKLQLKRKDASTFLPQWKRGPKGHSSKPIEFYDFIESCSPGPYLELFARIKRDKWVSWGSEI